MDPYLEQSAFWSSFHSRLIVALADAIEPQLSSQYYVEVETRTYQSDESEEVLIGIPDAIVFSTQSDVTTGEQLSPSDTILTYPMTIVTQARPEQVSVPMPLEIKERYLEVRSIRTDEVITVIELLSPNNKRSGDGRTAYEKKRRAILGSTTHLVEVDLLRGHKPMAILGVKYKSEYRILISRSHQRPVADLYNITLLQQLPTFSVPLKPNEEEPLVHLQELFNGVYDRARYATRIDYSQPIPPPALSETNRQWVEKLLAPIRQDENATPG
jgi:hypothetical protein